jgi:hypothetical protein
MSDSEPPTPRIQLLLSRLKTLNNDLQINMNRLVLRLEPSDDCLVLLPAVSNIIDRAREKTIHLSSYKVILRDTLDSKIEYDTLD